MGVEQHAAAPVTEIIGEAAAEGAAGGGTEGEKKETEKKEAGKKE